MSDLERLSAEVARGRDAWLAEHGLYSREQARFLAAFREQQAKPRQGRSRTAWLIALGALAAAAGILIVLWNLQPSGLTAYLATESREVNAGDALEAQEERSELHFNDGSQIDIEKGGEAQVVNLRDSGAQVRLTKGKLRVHIVHQADTRWTLDAGPYQVLVTGTRFEISYDQSSKHLSLTMQEGEVVVSGGDLDKPLTLKAGESVALPQARQAAKAEAGSLSASEHQQMVKPATSHKDTTLPSSAIDARQVETGSQSSSGRASPSLAPDSWLARARAGQYPAAYELARSAGFEKLTATASPSELLVLADVARFSGHQSQARSALNALRSRFTGSKEAATAAFQLGRLSGTSREAVTWFRRYLRERPAGSLAREASGRLMELLSKLGDTNAARRQAEAYLARYPGGPHADFARKLLNP